MLNACTSQTHCASCTQGSLAGVIFNPRSIQKLLILGSYMHECHAMFYNFAHNISQRTHVIKSRVKLYNYNLNC